jgi:hypothetical protein
MDSNLWVQGLPWHLFEEAALIVTVRRRAAGVVIGNVLFTLPVNLHYNIGCLFLDLGCPS